MAVQVAFEKAVDEAKLIHASSRGDLAAGGRRAEGGSAALYRGGHRRPGHGEEASALSTGSASGNGEVGATNLFANLLVCGRHCFLASPVGACGATWIEG